MWLIPNIDVFGGAADNAFTLGEDTADHEVLVPQVLAVRRFPRQHPALAEPTPHITHDSCIADLEL